MHRLASDPERLGDLWPGPASGQRALDARVLDAVSETPKCADGGESFSRIVWARLAARQPCVNLS